MSPPKILFADDQIPDESIPDDATDTEIIAQVAVQHPDLEMPLIRPFPKLRRWVKALKEADYDVTPCNRLGRATELIQAKGFDIAIVDLGWAADDELPKGNRNYAGWNLCDAIDAANARSDIRRTVQIVFSNRFLEKPELSRRAAKRGALPVFKDYRQATPEPLLAAIAFMEQTLLPPLQAAERNERKLKKLERELSETLSLQHSLIKESSEDRRLLVSVLMSHFSNDEIDLACYALGIDHEMLPRDTKVRRVLELIVICERRSQLDKLMAYCRAERPQAFN